MGMRLKVVKRRICGWHDFLARPQVRNLLDVIISFMDSIVAVDIETTGLDSDNDSIIEIGAVRFNQRRVEGEWSTLINPGRRIPAHITQLTGINDQMVLQAPPIHDVLTELEDFVGYAPILGHNVRFDLTFLGRHGLFHHNDAIDTYEMASVLLPEAGRYNLSALAQNLGVLLPATHRALDDAQATRGIFLRMYDKLMQLPLNLLAEIVRLSEAVDWGGYWVFQHALRVRSKEGISPRETRHAYHGPLFDQVKETSYAPLQPLEEPLTIDPEEAAAIIEYGGAFSQHFPQFEHRPEQVAMVHAVAEALSQGRHLLVEAGTGTGKSMAYLIPAALWSTQNNNRVVISTNTINLQDQLIGKDIPDLRAVLDLDLRAAILKGRSNYICPRRVESLRRRGPESPNEMRVLGKVLVWLDRTHSGDRAEINLNGPVENDIWRRLSAEDENCTAENCLKHTGGSCPFYRSRQAAQSAHLLIVNHALLLADVATGSRVIPEYDTLIVDEAHHLEDAVTNALSFRATQGDVERMLRELGGPTAGDLGWLVSSAQDSLPPSDFASLNQLIKKTTDIAFQIQSLVRQFFTTTDKFLFEQRDRKPVGPYPHQERILPATRTQPAWTDVEVAWENAQRKLQKLLESLATIIQSVADSADQFPEEDIDLYNTLSNLYRRFKEFNEKMNALVFDPEPDSIYWAEVRPNNGQVTLHAAPLHIGPLMQKHLWHEKISMVLTSATLTAAGEFDYIRNRLFAEDAYELALGSPWIDSFVSQDRWTYTGIVHLLRSITPDFTGYRSHTGERWDHCLRTG